MGINKGFIGDLRDNLMSLVSKLIYVFIMESLFKYWWDNKNNDKSSFVIDKNQSVWQW